MTPPLDVVRTQRVPFVPGGPVHAVRHDGGIALVALGAENDETLWVEVGADGTLGGPVALPFAVESVGADGERFVLSGNELGSVEPLLLTVAGDGTVVGRTVVDRGPDTASLTRWPVPVATPDGPALLWESSAGLFWSAPDERPRPVPAPAGTDDLAVVGATGDHPALIARTTVDGAVEVCRSDRREWRRAGVEEWVDAVAGAAVDRGGWIVVAGERSRHRLVVLALDPDLEVVGVRRFDVPGGGTVLSSTVRVAVAGASVVVSTSRQRRSRGSGGAPATAGSHAVAAFGSDLRGTDAPVWRALEPAGRLHHALVADPDGRVIVVHGPDDAFVTELRLSPEG